MLKLRGNHIILRALEPEDLDFLYDLENANEVWEVSGTTTPYARHVLKLYLENAHRDIYDVKQLRLCITSVMGERLGLIDLFDFDPKHRRAGLGILIAEEKHRNKGIGKEAVELLCDYAFDTLDLHQLFANVGADNKRSIHLFKKLGFVQAGLKEDWNYINGRYQDELLFQKINK